MATTIKNASFNSTIIDRVTLNGVNYGNTNIKSISACNEVVQKIVTIPYSTASQGHVALFGANAVPDTAGDVTFSEFKYARITNLDDTNSIILKITDQDGSASSATPTCTITFEIPAGMSFIVPSGEFDCSDDADFSGQNITSSSTWNTTMKISAVAVTADVDVEFVVVTT